MSDEGRDSDTFHKLGIVALAAYAWQLHGWLLGLAVLIALPIAVIVSNIAITAAAPESKVLRLLRVNRWSWLIFAGIVLAVSGASISNVST